MKIEQVAIQLYTLRDYCKTEEQLNDTLKKVKGIGYQAIQVSGIGPIAPAIVKSLADENDLIICATHEPGQDLFNTPEKVIEKLNTLDCKHTAYPYPGGIEFHKPGVLDQWLKDLETAYQILKQSGISLSYHNHHIEFMKVDGKIIMDHILERTSMPAELDTYWVHHGGGSNVEWCQKFKNRLPLLHLKDFKINNDIQIEFSEIGAGNLNFKAIIEAAEESGCEWFIVEQDSCPGDPFDSIKQSFDYVEANLVV